MRSLPFVSIVIPTRNRAGLLRDCVSSLLVQDYPEDSYEVIVLDDGSTDDTSAAVRSIRQQGARPPLRYVFQPPLGLNAARNAGAEIAAGDPILFVDDDTEVPSFWLKEFVTGSVRHPHADCFGGPIRLRLEGKAPRLCGREPIGETELDLGETEGPVATVWGANMGVRRHAIELIGPFNDALLVGGDEEEWEDRLRAAGRQIVYLPRAWLTHRRTKADLTLAKLLRSRFQRGRAQAANATRTGDRLRLRDDLTAIPRFLGHTVRRRCFWGILAASARVGRAFEVLNQRLGSFGRSARREGTTQNAQLTRVPTVMVILPTRNRLRLLKEAVASVVAQTFRDWGLVVVDDRSDDGTDDWLAGQVDRRIRAVRLDRHSERSAARNRGLAQCRSEFVLFLDDDDRLCPRALERLVAALRKHPRAVAVIGARMLFDDTGRQQRLPHPWVRMERDASVEALTGWVAPAGMWLAKASVLHEIGGWDEALNCAEDQDLWFRLLQRGPVVFLPRVVLECRVHSGQWRPPDVRAIENRIRERYVSGLGLVERPRAVELLKARAILGEADEAYRGRLYTTALARYARAIRLAPALLRSPLVGPSLFLMLAKSVVAAVLGPRALLAAKWLRSAVTRPIV